MCTDFQFFSELVTQDSSTLLYSQQSAVIVYIVCVAHSGPVFLNRKKGLMTVLSRKHAFTTVMVAVVLSVWATAAYADTDISQSGRWVESDLMPLSPEQTAWPGSEQLQTADAPARTKGQGWYELQITLPAGGDWVIDFRNSSVVGRFQHIVLDADDEEILRFSGGQLDSAQDDYWLRHGRDITLDAGDYRVLTQVDSPFLLAEPQPRLFAADDYARNAGYTVVFTLVGIGIFLALGFYYLVLGLWRRSDSDLLYVGFILGNLIYNGTALLVAKAVLPGAWFYGISAPILVSNVIYIFFVMRLLRVGPVSHPVLYRVGVAAIVVMVSFWPIALILPHWSLELCRIGVAIFALYGFLVGIVRTVQGSRVARLYLMANLVFLIPAMLAISMQNMTMSDVFLVEHMGLLAVLLEVLMLSYVMSYQVGQLQKEQVRRVAAGEQARLLSHLAQQMPGMVYQLKRHPDGRMSVPFVTPGVQQLLELTPDAVQADAKALFDRIHPEDASRLWSSLEQATKRFQGWQREFRVVLPKAGTRWLSSQAHPERMSDGSILWHGFVSDVTVRREAEEEVRHLAAHDPLTGCLNRVSLDHQLHRILSQADRQNQQVAVLFVDLDHFKPINDEHGHTTGDELLKVLANRIQSSVRATDLVARIGGDEFVVVLAPIEDANAAAGVARKLGRAISEPVDLGSVSLSTTASIGVALFPHQGRTQAELTECADKAMYLAKQRGRNQMVLSEHKADATDD